MQAETDRREIRCAIRSGNPEKPGPILYSTGDNQKVHLVSRDSRGVDFGQYVIANLVRDLERCAIYHCEAVGDDRMVVRAILANDMSQTFVCYHGKQECYWGTHNKLLEDFAELANYSSHQQAPPWSDQLQEWTMLIEKGKEGEVLDTISPYLDNTLIIEFCPCGHIERLTEEQMKKLGFDPQHSTFPSSDCPQCKADQEEENRLCERILTE